MFDQPLNSRIFLTLASIQLIFSLNFFLQLSTVHSNFLLIDPSHRIYFRKKNKIVISVELIFQHPVHRCWFISRLRHNRCVMVADTITLARDSSRIHERIFSLARPRRFDDNDDRESFPGY